MTTRRNIIALITFAPWLSFPAQAAAKITAEYLYSRIADRLHDILFMRQQYFTLRFFVELLVNYPPEDNKYKYDPKKMEASINTLSRMILIDKKPYSDVPPEFLKEWVSEYNKRQPSLHDYFKQVGIDINTPVNLVVETAIFTTVVYFASATGTKKLADTKICIWPFCDPKPT